LRSSGVYSIEPAMIADLVVAHRERLSEGHVRANTPDFATAQRQRKKVEALFAELKNQIGLRRLPLRRLKFVREQPSWQRWPRTSSD
jgi:hypothetical protein